MNVTETLTERLDAIRNEALTAVADRSKFVDEAKGRVRETRADLLEAVKVAIGAGAEPADVARSAGLSESTVRNWARPPKAETTTTQSLDLNATFTASSAALKDAALKARNAQAELED